MSDTFLRKVVGTKFTFTVGSYENFNHVTIDMDTSGFNFTLDLDRDEAIELGEALLSASEGRR